MLWLAVFFIMGQCILACGLLPAEMVCMLTEAGQISNCAFQR